MTVRSIPTLLLAGGILALAGCAPAEETAEAGEEDTVATEEAAAATEQPQEALPDTTVDAVFAYLDEQNAAEAWELWPGKERLYQGTDPHGALLTTYLNPTAYDALTGDAGSLPHGSIVVKENYMPDSTLAATTVMYKAEGYDAEHNDWWWVKRLADGTVEASGRVQGCIGCHGGAAQNDYIMTADLTEF